MQVLKLIRATNKPHIEGETLDTEQKRILLDLITVNEYTFRGSNSAIFIFASFSIRGQLL